ncbi:CoA transferase [Microbacterium sp. BWT-B31]|uniref:CaiB/BaiF CoA transferase family protein n=1 Tax=Microbacterium sp. BWT-B31 TaxID=3232072 RepID=UPI003527FCFC
MLSGVRVIEIADEQAEYVGLLLAGLGAEVIKIEPPEGNSTRSIGPFAGDERDPEGSLYFWHYNRAKQSVALDLTTSSGRAQLRELAANGDVLVDSTKRGYLSSLGVSLDNLRAAAPSLITARVTPFGDDGPWSDWKGSDLIHLALGGPMMNSGYDPAPDGRYDLPPIAPQMWQAYHITGEQLALAIVAALVQRQRTGRGQHLDCAVHDAVSKCTELDIASWVMRAIPFYRQTSRHAAAAVSKSPTIAYTKDGRWVLIQPVAKERIPNLLVLLEKYGLDQPLRADFEAAAEPTGGALTGRYIPGSSAPTDLAIKCHDSLQRLFAKFTFDEVPWQEAQDAGILAAPLRRPEENIADPHWKVRSVFSEIEHPERDVKYVDITGKWVSDTTAWVVGARAPRLDEHHPAAGALKPSASRSSIPSGPRSAGGDGEENPFPLAGIRIFDFSWFLASAGGTRFLTALGAECIKVEWKSNPDSRLAVTAMAPVGGREARDRATGPLEGISATDYGDDYQNMGGQFHLKNSGKRGISLNVRDPRGLEIARRLISMSDVVAEGFSPGVLERWGLGYDVLRELKPDIIYAKQSGMGAFGTYGRMRTVGPVAQAFSGISELSGLPAPAMPAGWGYSYLDWIGAYSFGLSIAAAIYHRNETGDGQWIDASQVESGLFLGGTAYLDASVNGRSWQRFGNRSPYKQAAPHGAYRCAGQDSWIAIACFTDAEWESLCEVAGHPEWRSDSRFATLSARLDHQDELDRVVTSWSATADARALMETLQTAGVPAGACQTAEDRIDRDPQLRHLNWMTEVTGTKIGTWPIPELPVRMSGSTATVAGRIGRGAPNYGEDNAYVYAELLGMSDDEIAALAADEVI